MSDGLRHLIGAGVGLVAAPVSVFALGWGADSLRAAMMALHVDPGLYLPGLASVFILGLLLGPLAGSRMSPLASLLPGVTLTALGLFALSPVFAELATGLTPLGRLGGGAVVYLLLGGLLIAASVPASRWRPAARRTAEAVPETVMERPAERPADPWTPPPPTWDRWETDEGVRVIPPSPHTGPRPPAGPEPRAARPREMRQPPHPRHGGHDTPPAWGQRPATSHEPTHRRPPDVPHLYGTGPLPANAAPAPQRPRHFAGTEPFAQAAPTIPQPAPRMTPATAPAPRETPHFHNTGPAPRAPQTAPPPAGPPSAPREFQHRYGGPAPRMTEPVQWPPPREPDEEDYPYSGPPSRW
ncbi:hypothetical protein ACQEU5_05195 [Marinactinospora thermotolerans]|uniref:Uncharacterized protein n=1 Tax=Marinactinospora thermotolerans DSM 45154 TaxID=1122192 RepID=A0A1T4QNB8_9ACTN|nr:hypothetical protein [Marinactinospora thermotolerans]SKA05263.1 hypothetical protein SAMN02745673_02332 [Marinactinospora thermotolerans DSM 45154]